MVPPSSLFQSLWGLNTSQMRTFWMSWPTSPASPGELNTVCSAAFLVAGFVLNFPCGRAGVRWNLPWAELTLACNLASFAYPSVTDTGRGKRLENKVTRVSVLLMVCTYAVLNKHCWVNEKLIESLMLLLFLQVHCSRLRWFWLPGACRLRHLAAAQGGQAMLGVI